MSSRGFKTMVYRTLYSTWQNSQWAMKCGEQVRCQVHACVMLDASLHVPTGGLLAELEGVPAEVLVPALKILSQRGRARCDRSPLLLSRHHHANLWLHMGGYQAMHHGAQAVQEPLWRARGQVSCRNLRA